MTHRRARAVFLDRDGVLNRAIVSDGKPGVPASLDEFVILPDAPVCLEELKRSGFCLLVVTNQPDVARGRQSVSMVEEMHRKLRRALPVDEIFVCFHDDADNCPCRKPRPGLLFDASEKYGLDLSGSFLIGDRWKDIEAGNAADCKTVFIDYQYRERGPATEPTVRVSSLRGAVNWIMKQTENGGGHHGRYT